MNTIIKAPDQPLYSIFVPFTRFWCVAPFLANFDAINIPRSESEIIFYNDTYDTDIQNALLTWLEKNGHEFNGAQLYQSGRQHPSEFDVTYRRQRICDMKNTSKDLLSDSTYVFCLEDDTLAPPQSFTKLLQHISDDDDLAVTSGIEVGRWALPIIGAWEIEPLIEPDTIRTVPFRQAGTQFVDGVGWYCYMTYTKLYKQAYYHYEGEALGPDVVYAWQQRKKGYKVLVDWSLPCAHMVNESERIIPTDAGTTEGIWHRRDGNNWELEDKPMVIELGIQTV